MNYNFNLFAIPNILCALFCLIIGSFVYFKNRKSQVNLLFFLMMLCGFVWQLGQAFVLLSNNETTAFIWSKIIYIGVIYIAVIHYHLIVAFLGLKNQRKIAILFYVISSFLFIPLTINNYIIYGVNKYSWGYWLKAAKFHPLFGLYFGFLIFLGIINLYFGYKKENISPIDRIKCKYLFLGFIISYLGSIDFLPDYGINIYPFGYVFITLYISIIAYAIVRYRLMDIALTITLTGIFVTLYTLVLGLP
ncbi:MAG: histidine kinase N-terminal 7TM domain-containing protein, partial [Candidatus Thorarchaeota archaeon]